MMRRTLTFVLACWLAGCTGVISDLDQGQRGPNGTRSGASASSGPGSTNGSFDPKNPDAPAAPVFACDASAEPPELALPRLSRVQLGNTLRIAIRLALP